MTFDRQLKHVIAPIGQQGWLACFQFQVAKNKLPLLLLRLLLLPGCIGGPRLLPVAEQKVIDRAVVEYPSGYELRPYVTGLSGPSAIAFNEEGSLLIADRGMRDDEPH